mmetsp:Transcript_37233/g.73771  ORF Transcript_37233/g.73771 Transcript_37233/m.73771 type:complete len:476 (+) Transcript_37233:79-1506(+)
MQEDSHTQQSRPFRAAAREDQAAMPTSVAKMVLPIRRWPKTTINGATDEELAAVTHAAGRQPWQQMWKQEWENERNQQLQQPHISEPMKPSPSLVSVGNGGSSPDGSYQPRPTSGKRATIEAVANSTSPSAAIAGDADELQRHGCCLEPIVRSVKFSGNDQAGEPREASMRFLARDASFRMLTSKEVDDLLQAVGDAKDAILSVESPRIVNLLNLESRIQAEVDREENEENEVEWTSCYSASNAGWNCNPDGISTMETTDSNSEVDCIGARRSCNVMVFGIVGGATGAAVGAAAGAVAGIPYAILTLGLSVPSCSGAGAAAGLCSGGMVGAAAAFKGANMTIACKNQSVPEAAWELESSGISQLCISVDLHKTQQKPDACNRQRTITLASAIGGGVVMGSIGGASGTAVGGMTGVTVGLIAAPLTMGLSIPVSVAIGTGLGFFTGTLTGMSTGFLGGGLAAKTGFACANMSRRTC